MAVDSFDRPAGRTKTRKEEERTYRFIFAVSFALFFVGALASRIVSRTIRPFAPREEGELSVIAEAKAQANSVIPYAFMN